MSYKLQSITVENLVVFTNRTKIDFSTDYINLIEGAEKNNSDQSNGTGKSLIIDAISLALFGKGIRSNYISDYISPSNPSGGIYIGLELIDSDGTQLKIERWKRSDNDINKAKVWKNGACISQDSTISKIDEMIQSYIGISHTNFMSCIFSVMIPGFLKLRPAQRFELLEQALAVKKIESVIKKINTAIKTDEDKLSQTIQVLSDVSNKYIAEKTKRDIYTNNIGTIHETILSQETELSALLTSEKDTYQKYTEYKKVLDSCDVKLSPLTTERDTLSADIRSLISSKQTAEAKLKSTLKAFKRTSTGSIECALCKSKLTDISKESITSHYTEEIDKIQEGITTKQDKIAALNKKITSISDIRAKAEKTLNVLTKQITCIQTNTVAIERSIASNKAALETAASSYDDQLLSKYKKDLEELTAVQMSLETDIKINTAWKHAMSKNGLRLAYIKEEVSTLSALSSKYATVVYEKPINIKFYIKDDKDNPTLDFTVNNKSAMAFSTGEGRRLEIAMTLSLMSLLKTSGLDLSFLILDEALDGLSESSKHAVLKMLDSLASEYQLLMISHDPAIKNRPGHIIQVTKDAATNISSITTSIRK